MTSAPPSVADAEHNFSPNPEGTVVALAVESAATEPTADQSDANPLPLEQHDPFSLVSALEALLFVSDGAVEVTSLAKVLMVTSEELYTALKALTAQLIAHDRGLRLQEHNGKFQLVSAPAYAALIETYLNLDTTTKLSAPALETLAIIAYRQPITRAQIEAVRGVDSAGILRSLVQRGLIEEAGRLEGVGRPIVYNVTTLFMQQFGLTGLDELPALETTDADTLWAATKLAELEAAA